MRHVSRTILSMCLVAAGACTGTDVGNPVVDVDYALYNDQIPGTGGAAFARGATGITAIDSAWITVDRVRLRDAGDCSGNAEVERLGPFSLDLLQPGPIPELTGIEVPGIDYCRFEFRWHKSSSPLAPGSPPLLDGASILITGTRGDSTPFILRSDRSDELRLDAVGGAFTIDDATNALIVGFDGVRLFSGLDLDTATVDGDGTIRIEDGSNDTLLGLFDDNVQTATELFDDNDNDGALDPEERDPTDVLAD